MNIATGETSRAILLTSLTIINKTIFFSKTTSIILSSVYQEISSLGLRFFDTLTRVKSLN